MNGMMTRGVCIGWLEWTENMRCSVRVPGVLCAGSGDCGERGDGFRLSTRVDDDRGVDERCFVSLSTTVSAREAKVKRTRVTRT